jgi:hypothetical protein
MKHDEYELQRQISWYLHVQYYNVLFLSDTIANLKLTKMQAIRNKKIQKEGFKTPDLLILEPRNGYSGLFIELKIATPFKKDGTIKASTKDHLKGQLESIEKLNQKGYKACFAVGFEETKKIIDDYLK